MNYLHGDYEQQKGLLKKTPTTQQAADNLVYVNARENVFVLVSGNDVPQLSKDELVEGESQIPVWFPLFCPFSFPHVVTGQGIGWQAEEAAILWGKLSSSLGQIEVKFKNPVRYDLSYLNYAVICMTATGKGTLKSLRCVCTSKRSNINRQIQKREHIKCLGIIFLSMNLLKLKVQERGVGLEGCPGEMPWGVGCISRG